MADKEGTAAATSETTAEPQEQQAAQENTKATEAVKADPNAETTKIEKKTALTADKVEEVSEPESSSVDDKEGEEDAVPEKYELTLPEGSQLTAQDVEKTTAIAKEWGLSNEEAQELLNVRHEAVSEYVNRANKEIGSWLGKAKSDKEIGGDNFGKNAELAKRVVDRFGTEEFKKALNDTGLGNHPELVRIFAKIGRSISEDTLVHPGTKVVPSKSMEEVFYGKQE